MRKITYRRLTVSVPADPPTECDACKRKLGKKIGKLDCHHWIYAYETKDVREHPALAIENSSDLCFPCHKKIADSIRSLMEQNIEKVAAVARTMPESMVKQWHELLIVLLLNGLE